MWKAEALLANSIVFDLHWPWESTLLGAHDRNQNFENLQQ